MQNWGLTIQIKKSDIQGKITGWASIVTDETGKSIVDHDGHIIPIDELERAVHQAFAKVSGAGRAGLMHAVTNQADVVESFVVTADKRAALGFGDGPEGWIVTLQVKNKELLEKIISGEYGELSLSGVAESHMLAKSASGQAEKQTRVLRNIVLNEAELLSLVTKGASGDGRLRPKIVLIKSKGKVEKMAIKEAIAKAMHDLVSLIKQDQESAQQKLETALSGIDEDKKAAILEAIAMLLKDKQAGGEAQPDKVDVVESEKLAKAKKELDDTKADLAKLMHERDLNEQIAISKSLACIPGDEVERAKALLLIKGSSADSHKILVDALTLANEQIAKSDIYKEKGSARSDDTTGAKEKIEQLAKAKRAEGLSEASARARVYIEHPDLFADIMKTEEN